MRRASSVKSPIAKPRVTVPPAVSRSQPNQPTTAETELSEVYEIGDPISHEELAANFRTRVAKPSKVDGPFYEGPVPFLLGGLDW